MAAWMAGQCEELGLAVQWQQVEEDRANVLATRAGTGGGPTLMFNGHLDTSYSGKEAWLAGIPGFQPKGFVREGRIYGLGISNMKGALVAYLAALRALGGCGAARRRPARGGRGGDREDAAGRRAGRGVPRLRGRLAVPRRPRRRGRHVHPRRADRAEARARPLRHALAPALDDGSVHPYGVLVRPAGGELDRAHARRARPRHRLAAAVGGGDVVRRRARRRQHRRRSRAGSAGARRGRRTGPTSSSTCACRRTSRWLRRGGGRSSSRARWTASRPRST